MALPPLARIAADGGVGAVVLGIALVHLAAVSIVLARIDIEERRLPDAIVLPSIVLSAAVLSLLDLSAAAPVLTTAVLGSLAYGGFLLLVRMTNPSAMGGGDVKLAVLLGLYLGAAGLERFAAGVAAAFALGGIHALIILAVSRQRGASIPFGPWMLLGAWIGLVAGPGSIADLVLG